MDLQNEDLQSICRTCLTTSYGMKNIFDIEYIITSCTTIQLNQDDGLPSTICAECTVLAKKAYGFRLLCEHSNQVLREALLTNNSTAINTEKNDLDIAEIHTDAVNSTFEETEVIHDQYQIQDSLAKIDLVNEVHETDTYEVQNIEHYDLWKTEIFEDKTINTDSNSSQIKQSEDNTTETNEVFEEECGSSLKENSNEVNSASDTETEKSKSEPFTCQYCGQKFIYQTYLRMHVQKHVEGLKCLLCNKTFQTIRQFRNHMYVHSRKGVHLCSTCGKQFTMPENLKAHQRIHDGIKPYKCKYCDKSFRQNADLKFHVRIHTREKPNLCSICGMSFSKPATLQNHTARIHVGLIRERKHVCTVCGKKFKDRYVLTKHMNCHSEKRNFICKVCNKGFKHRRNLQLHEKIHMGVKPHVCPICQRAFLQKHVLTSHLRTHTHQT